MRIPPWLTTVIVLSALSGCRAIATRSPTTSAPGHVAHLALGQNRAEVLEALHRLDPELQLQPYVRVQRASYEMAVRPTTRPAIGQQSLLVRFDKTGRAQEYGTLNEERRAIHVPWEIRAPRSDAEWDAARERAQVGEISTLPLGNTCNVVIDEKPATYGDAFTGRPGVIVARYDDSSRRIEAIYFVQIGAVGAKFENSAIKLERDPGGTPGWR